MVPCKQISVSEGVTMSIELKMIMNEIKLNGGAERAAAPFLIVYDVIQ